MKKFLFLVLISSLITLSACSRRSNLEKLSETTDSVNKFTFDFLSQIEAGNNFFSPYSIYTSLVLFYEGAEGDTKQQLAEVLYLEEAKRETGNNLRQLNRELHKRETDGIAIKTANALWLDKEVSLKRNFKTRANRFYDAIVRSLDFRNRPDESITEINNWVFDKTDGFISNILLPSSIQDETKIIATNTIYFLGKWADDFSKDDTKYDAFYISPEEACRVLFMNKTSSYSSYETEYFQAIEIPYLQDELAVVIFLPIQGHTLEDFLQSFDYEQYKETINSYTTRRLEVSIPRFEFSSNYGLKAILSKLGLHDLFTQRADLTGISDFKPGLMLDEMYHQTHIEVKEEGTEARAITISNFNILGFDINPSFAANRPFIFIIRDKISESILFSGTLYNPDPTSEVVSHVEAEHVNITYSERIVSRKRESKDSLQVQRKLNTKMNIYKNNLTIGDLFAPKVDE